MWNIHLCFHSSLALIQDNNSSPVIENPDLRLMQARGTIPFLLSLAFKCRGIQYIGDSMVYITQHIIFHFYQFFVIVIVNQGLVVGVSSNDVKGKIQLPFTNPQIIIYFLGWRGLDEKMNFVLQGKKQTMSFLFFQH